MKLHLPKGLFVAVVAAMAAMMPASYAADTEIWVNFGGTDYEVTEEGKTWNNILGNNGAALSGTYTLQDIEGTTAGRLTLSANGKWQTSANLDVLESFLDYNAGNQSQYWNLSISGFDDIAASGITVNAYVSGDSGNPFAPLTVNGTNYTVDEEGKTTVGDSTWGSGSTATSQSELNSKNTVTVTNLSGTVTLTPKKTASNDKGRFNLAGLSIVWDGSTSATEVELDTGVNNADTYLKGVETANRIYSLSGNADNTSTFHIAAGETVQGLQSAANTVTITSDGAIGVNQLWAKAGTTLNLGAPLTSGSDLSIGGLGTINFAANQTIGKLTSTAATVSVAEGAQLTIGSMENATEAGKFITNVKGKGSIEFKSNVFIQGTKRRDGSNPSKILTNPPAPTKTVFEGDLKISNQATLYIGHDGGGHQWGYYTDLSSLRSLQLNDAKVYYHGEENTIKSLVINTTNASDSVISTFHVEDMGTDQRITFTNMTLNADLDITATWGSRWDVEALTGAGNLTIKSNTEDAATDANLSIAEGFLGKITILNNGKNSTDTTAKTTVDISIADGVTLNDTQLINNTKATLTLKGSGNYNITSPTSAITNGLTNDKSWTGTVRMSGATLGNADNKATLSDYGNAKSTIRFDGASQSTGYFATESVNPNIELYGNNLACLDLASGQLTFTGKVSGGGNMGTSAGAASEVAVTFTGDVSEWTGVYWAAKATDITYSGNAKSIKNTLTAGEGAESTVTFVNTSGMTVDGGINNQLWSNGTLNLKVQNAKNAAGTVVFNGEVFEGVTEKSKTATTNLTVGEGASAKFTNANVKLTNVTMEKSASLAITAAKTLTFQNLTLADGTTINPREAATLVDAAEATTNVSITVSKKASFGAGATINADLTLASGATVEMADALTLGGTLTLNTGLTLGGELLTTIVGFAEQAETQKQILFTVAGLNLVGADALTTAAEVGISETTKVAFSDYFTNDVTTETGDYYLGYDGSNVYVEFVAKADEPEEDPSTPEGGGNVPEPTTGALSLLGLAALAMRRRRRA